MSLLSEKILNNGVVEWAVSSEQWAVGSEQWAVGSEQWAVRGQWVVGSRQ